MYQRPDLTKLEQQLVGLSAAMSAAKLVQDIAQDGEADEQQTQLLLASITVLNPEDVFDVYDEPQHLVPAVRDLQSVYSSNLGGNNTSVSKYVLNSLLGLLHVAKALNKNDDAKDNLRKDIEALARRNSFATEEIGLASKAKQFAQIYLDNVSPLPYRIKVQGKPEQLQNENNVLKIRALLLAGVRAAFLWQQMGGSKWQFIFKRSQITHSLSTLEEKIR